MSNEGRRSSWLGQEPDRWFSKLGLHRDPRRSWIYGGQQDARRSTWTTISSKSINDSLVDCLLTALARKLKRTEPELFYLGFRPGKWATHIETFMTIGAAINIKALRLLLKDYFFDPRSFGFPPPSPVRVGRFFINWSVRWCYRCSLLSLISLRQGLGLPSHSPEPPNKCAAV